MEAGKRRLAGDIARAASNGDVQDLRREARALKECVADLTLENRILLENHFLPGDLERQIEAFIEHYNHQRYHESLQNVTPADAYFGRASTIIKQRETIKRNTIAHRRLQHRAIAA